MFKAINLQLFAEETIPVKAEEANLDNKPEEKGEFGSIIRDALGLKGKEAKKEPEKLPENKNTEVKPEDKKDLETKEPDVKKDKQEPEEEFIPIKHLGKEVKIPKSEQQKYLQMGYDYQHVKGEAETAKAALQRIAKVEGFDTVDEYLAELSNKEKTILAEKIEEAAGDPDKIDEVIQNHPVVKQTKEERRKLDYANTKSELSKDRFFKELEPELDRLMEANPEANAGLVYKVIRSDYLTPERLSELITKEKTSAEKKVLADVHDKERRAAPTGGDVNDGKEVVQPTSFGNKLYGLFGLDKAHAQKAAQRAHEKMKRS